ncbi:MAG: acetylglutamate kinase [Alkalispirochaeta sp.]
MKTVVKIGGTVAEDAAVTRLLFDEIAAGGYPGSVVVVHGGGKAVTRISERLGITPVFEDGVRVTPPEEMELVDMVLAGRVNTELVRIAGAAGTEAVGVTGADRRLLTGRCVGDPEGNRTARVERVDPAVLDGLLADRVLPIVATVGTGTDGAAVNINADEAARAIAVALAEDGEEVALCYLSDIPGVLDVAGSVISGIVTTGVEALITDGTIRGGMAAKIRAAAGAVTAGVSRVVIGGYLHAGDLGRLLAGDAGTTVRMEQEETTR